MSGIQIINADGRVLMTVDSEAAFFIQAIQSPANGSPFSVTWPSLAGTEIYGVSMSDVQIYGGSFSTSIAAATFTVDYLLGYPRMNVTPGPRETLIYAFAH